MNSKNNLFKSFLSLRSKLSSFVIIILVVIISLLLIVALKRQTTMVMDFSQESIEKSVLPLEELNREVVEIAQAYINYERLKYLADKRKGDKKERRRYPFDTYFSPKKMERIGEYLAPKLFYRQAKAISDREKRNIKATARWLALHSPQNSNYETVRWRLERSIRKAMNFASRVEGSLVGQDLSKIRFEAIDLGRNKRYDSRNDLLSQTQIATVNSFDKRTQKKLHQNFSKVYDRYKKQQKPTFKPRQYLIRPGNKDILISTQSLFIDSEVSQRAIWVLRGLEHPIWKKYAFSEKKINDQLERLADKIVRRELELHKDNGHPRYDKKLKSFTKRYKELNDKRQKLLEETTHRYFERTFSDFLIVQRQLPKLKKQKKELQQKLQKAQKNARQKKPDNQKNDNNNKENNKEKEPAIAQSPVQTLQHKLEAIEKQIKANQNLLTRWRQQKHYKIADSFRNLRRAALYSDTVLFFDIKQKRYRRYFVSASEKKRTDKAFRYLRTWVHSYRYETYLPRYYRRGGYLQKTRSEAAKRMYDYDKTNLEKLSYKLLTDKIAGFTRVFLDRTETYSTIREQRAQMIDISISIALRVLIISFLISGIMVRAIRSIIGQADKIRAGDLNVTFSYKGSDELGNLVHSLNNMVEGLQQKEKLEGEIAAAEEIQKFLLPKTLPDSLTRRVEIGRFYKAMVGVGGDYYDFIELPGQKSLFCIADVSNHGIGPAMIMAILRSQLRNVAFSGESDPLQILVKLNDVIEKETPDDIFITMFLATYDLQNHKVLACSAGHNKAILLRHSAKENDGNSQEGLEELELRGMPLGAIESSIFESTLEQKEIQLQPGDLLFQYTDGVNEAMTSSGTQFGAKRLHKALKSYRNLPPQTLVENLAKSVQKFTQKKIIGDGPSEINDDIAIIALKRIP